MIVQAYVPEQLELRITVVGDRIFTAAIHSQQSHRTRHDWRRHDLASTRHPVHELPPDVAGRCIALVQSM